jgi:hypothetical protein
LEDAGRPQADAAIGKRNTAKRGFRLIGQTLERFLSRRPPCGSQR